MKAIVPGCARQLHLSGSRNAMQWGLDVQQEWGKAQLKWDHSPRLSTEQESEEAGI